MRSHRLGTVPHSDSQHAHGSVCPGPGPHCPVPGCAPRLLPASGPSKAGSPLLTSPGPGGLALSASGHLSPVSALAFSRCRRDPRARGPRPPGRAPTPAGSGGGGRTLFKPCHRPAPVRTERPSSARGRCRAMWLVAESAPPPPELRGEGLAATFLRSSFAKFAWCLCGSCCRPPRDFAPNLCSLLPGTCSEHHAETSSPSFETRCVWWGAPLALGRKSRHSGSYHSPTTERRTG